MSFLNDDSTSINEEGMNLLENGETRQALSLFCKALSTLEVEVDTLNSSVETDDQQVVNLIPQSSLLGVSQSKPLQFKNLEAHTNPLAIYNRGFRLHGSLFSSRAVAHAPGNSEIVSAVILYNVALVRHQSGINKQEGSNNILQGAMAIYQNVLDILLSPPGNEGMPLYEYSNYRPLLVATLMNTAHLHAVFWNGDACNHCLVAARDALLHQTYTPYIADTPQDVMFTLVLMLGLRTHPYFLIATAA